MKVALIVGVLAVFGSGCGVASSIEFTGFDDMKCRPDGNDTRCTTKIHFTVERGVAKEDGVAGQVDGWETIRFRFPIDRGGSHSWTLEYFFGGPCQGGEVTLSAYLELIDEYEGEHEEDSANDTGAETVDVHCADE